MAEKTNSEEEKKRKERMRAGLGSSLSERMGLFQPAAASAPSQSMQPMGSPPPHQPAMGFPTLPPMAADMAMTQRKKIQEEPQQARRGFRRA